MEFAFTEEQQMIRDTAAAFLQNVSDSGAVRQAMATDAGYDPELWRRICEEMYWQAIPVPEAYGGLGLGYVELVAVLEQMGRFLVCAPFFSTVCLGVNALLVAGTEAQKETWLPRLAAGELTATLAYTGTAGHWDARAIEATWSREGDGYRLQGTYRYVPDGATADLLVVAARKAGTTGEAGIALFLVPADTDGVTRSPLPTMDQTRRQGVLELDATVPAEAVMRDPGEAWPALATVLDLATVAVAADQAGGAQQVLDLSTDYALERVQFGRPIAGFQAIKHKAADMMLKSEVARSAIYYAACVASEVLSEAPDPALAEALPEAASMAKVYCSDAYFFNAGTAIQIHGGVGFTWEYDVHLYFKRAKSTETLLGPGHYHRERVARLLLD